MKNWHQISLLLLLLFCVKNVHSQNITFEVIDSYNEKALNGVKIEPICADRTAFTNSEGKASLNLELEHCCNIKISKLGYAPETVEVCPEDKRIELYFFRTFNIKGNIKSSTGTALNRARIAFSSECGDGKRVAYTDALGNFKFSPPAIGACCYEMIISHAEHTKNTAVFCTTDEVHEKDIRIDYTLSDTEKFSIAEPSYTTKTITPTSQKPTITTAAYQYVNTTTPPQQTSTSSIPQYVTPSTPQYTAPSPQQATAPPAPQYIDPTNLTLNTTTPISANLTYFDVNQSAIRSDAYIRLDNVATFMQNSPDLIVEIAVHCDSRGDYTYNQNLSERRARALADYLVGKGIGKDRLIVQGYGESQLINHCADGIRCSEVEHRQNRRALFQVKGSIYDADYTPAHTYAAYRAPLIKPAAGKPKPSSPTPPGVPCPDCPVKELDDEAYMDKLHGEEYYDDNFYDTDDGNQ